MCNCVSLFCVFFFCYGNEFLEGYFVVMYYCICLFLYELCVYKEEVWKLNCKKYVYYKVKRLL